MKKMKINIKKRNKNFENEILKVFQEIRFLAKIKGEYIVDYNHSWVEVNLIEDKNSNKNFNINPTRGRLLNEADLDFKNCQINTEEDDYENVNFFDYNNYNNNHENMNNQENELYLNDICESEDEYAYDNDNYEGDCTPRNSLNNYNSKNKKNINNNKKNKNKKLFMLDCTISSKSHRSEESRRSSISSSFYPEDDIYLNRNFNNFYLSDYEQKNSYQEKKQKQNKYKPFDKEDNKIGKKQVFLGLNKPKSKNKKHKRFSASDFEERRKSTICIKNKEYL